MALVETIEISGEEREIADAVAREQCAANAEGITELNSNLSQLEYDEHAGGKNLCLIDREDSNGWSYSKSIYYKGTYTVSSNNTEVNTVYIIDDWHSLPYTFTADGHYDFAFQKPMSITSKCIQIEEGTQATDYEPYIPSVKMLAEEVSAQKNDLGGLSFSVSGTTLSITDGTNTWTLSN